MWTALITLDIIAMFMDKYISILHTQVKKDII